jgi:pyrroline-5-carboxylate reductase
MAPVLLLAVKPQIFGMVASAIERFNPDQVIISILAGVSIAQLERAFPDRAVVRAMPNTPATVGMGLTAIAAGSRVSAAQMELATEIFQAVGDVVTVPESLMDAVTGLSGSGPAYVAIAIEALADGGVAAGLPRAIADRLALQTVLGTATLLKESQLHPAQLKDRVTSPGGTTIAGVTKLEQAGFRSALIEAVIAASKRSQELGNG